MVGRSSRHRTAVSRAVILVLVAALVGACVGASGGTESPGDTARRAAALEALASRPIPLATRSDRDGCRALQDEARMLIASSERARLQPGSSARPEPERYAEVANRLRQRQGSRAPGPCARPRFGGPATMNAAASLAFALHRYGRGWPSEIRSSIHRVVAQSHWTPPRGPRRLHNLHVALPVAAILAGEAMGDAALAQRGLRELTEIAERTARHGPIEINSPLYSAHHWTNLALLTSARSPRASGIARALLEYELLVTGHLYLPGGGIGAPQSRSYGGGIANPDAARGVLPLIWIWFGDPALAVNLDAAYTSIVVAAVDYQPPPVVRSIYLDKSDGVAMKLRHEAQQSKGRTPTAIYRMGKGRTRGYAWQAATLPRGSAALGFTYGANLSATLVSSGALLQKPGGGFASIYHYQPGTTADSDHLGRPLGGSGRNVDPADFISEGTDFERIGYGYTVISLWDPRASGAARRATPETRAWLPDFDGFGGRLLRRRQWWFGELGETLVAFRPFGKEVRVTRKESGWEVVLPGISGSVLELAPRASAPTLERFATAVEARYFHFDAAARTIEFDAGDPDGGVRRLRLEYAPERRFVDGVVLPRTSLEHVGLLDSTWVRWEDATSSLTVDRPGYAIRHYRLTTGEIVETPR